MKKFVIIVAGGSGTRMNNGIPKQFLLLKDKPVLAHSIEKFNFAVPDIHIIVALPKHLWNDWKSLCKIYDFNLAHTLAEGGETRFNSVKNGLSLISEEGLIAIHDAARPLISLKLIQSCFEAAEKLGNAIPAIPITESVREYNGEFSKIANRDKLRIIQTPQCFTVSKFKEAYQQNYKPEFTDDANVMESTGEKIHLIEGEKTNFKITYSEDLLVAEAILGKTGN